MIIWPLGMHLPTFCLQGENQSHGGVLRKSTSTSLKIDKLKYLLGCGNSLGYTGLMKCLVALEYPAVCVCSKYLLNSDF